MSGSRFKLVINDRLLNDWQPIIERQVSLQIAALWSEIRSARLRFVTESFRDDDLFLCEVLARTRRGEQIHVGAHHSDGHVAIGDAVARARRAILRSLRTRPAAFPRASSGKVASARSR